MKTTKVTINHRNLGTVKVTMDEEDKYLLQDYNLSLKAWVKEDRAPIVIARPKGSKVANDYVHLSRLILSEHNMLDYSQNVFYKNKSSFDLKKKNLLCGKRN